MAQDEAPRRKQIGKYEITAVLGRGGMGLVYRAHDPLIERDVAIKVLPPELAAQPRTVQRFLSEARAAGKLNHPNAVAIYEIGQEGDDYFLVLELVTGGTIQDELARGPLTVVKATRAAADACRGLSALHELGLTHRDIKPGNLLRTERGEVKVGDFGLARAEASDLTQTGELVGTPHYISPEQIVPDRLADARSDIYSLGAAYYSMLTGETPYANSDSAYQVMYAHINAEVLDPRAKYPALPQACSRIVRKAMAKAPGDRYQSAEAMLSDLNSVLDGLSGASIELPSDSAIRTDSLRRSGGGSLPRGVRVGLMAGLTAAALIVAALVLFSGGGGRGMPTGEPVRVGVLHSLTGTMAISETAVVDATLFAIEEVNREGGVLGRPVEAVVADGRSNSDVFKREARRLIAEEKVATVFGCWTSASRKTAVPVFEELDHLLVYPVQYEGMEQSPNVLYVGAAPNQQIFPAVQWAHETLGKRRFFLVGSDYVFPRAANEALKDYLQELRVEVVGERYVPLGSSDVRAVVQDIVAARADMILNTINGDTNVAFFRALRAAGVSPDALPTLSFCIGEHELRSLDPEQMTGDYAAWTYFQSLDTPENAEFLAAFRKKYGPQHAVNDPMEAAYVGVMLWAAAVREAGATDVRAIRRALRAQRMVAPEGPVRVEPNSQHLFKTPRVGRILSDGNFEIVWSADKPLKPNPYPDSRTAEDWKAFLHDLYRSWGERWSAPQR